MKLEKKHWVIIAVVIAVIVVWYFFLRKKKTTSSYATRITPRYTPLSESGFTKKIAGVGSDTKGCPSGCRATSVSGPNGTTTGCYCPGAGWQ